MKQQIAKTTHRTWKITNTHVKLLGTYRLWEGIHLHDNAVVREVPNKDLSIISCWHQHISGLRVEGENIWLLLVACTHHSITTHTAPPAGSPMRKKSGSVRVFVSPPSGMVHTRILASSHATCVCVCEWVSECVQYVNEGRGTNQLQVCVCWKDQRKNPLHQQNFEVLVLSPYPNDQLC